MAEKTVFGYSQFTFVSFLGFGPLNYALMHTVIHSYLFTNIHSHLYIFMYVYIHIRTYNGYI